MEGGKSQNTENTRHHKGKVYSCTGYILGPIQISIGKSKILFEYHITTDTDVRKFIISSNLDERT